MKVYLKSAENNILNYSSSIAFQFYYKKESHFSLKMIIQFSKTTWQTLFITHPMITPVNYNILPLEENKKSFEEHKTQYLYTWESSSKMIVQIGIFIFFSLSAIYSIFTGSKAINASNSSLPHFNTYASVTSIQKPVKQNNSKLKVVLDILQNSRHASISINTNGSITIQCKEKNIIFEETTPFSLKKSTKLVRDSVFLQEICDFRALMVKLNLENTVTCDLLPINVNFFRLQNILYEAKCLDDSTQVINSNVSICILEKISNDLNEHSSEIIFKTKYINFINKINLDNFLKNDFSMSIPLAIKSQLLPNNINKAESSIEIIHRSTPNTRDLIATLNGSLQPKFAQKKLNLGLRIGGNLNIYSPLINVGSAQKSYIFGSFDMIVNYSKSLKIISQIPFPNNKNLAIGLGGDFNCNTQWSALLFPMEKKGEIQIRIPLNSFRIPKKASIMKPLLPLVNKQVEPIAQKSLSSLSTLGGPYATTGQNQQDFADNFRRLVYASTPRSLLRFARPVVPQLNQQIAGEEPNQQIAGEKPNQIDSPRVGGTELLLRGLQEAETIKQQRVKNKINNLTTNIASLPTTSEGQKATTSKSQKAEISGGQIIRLKTDVTSTNFLLDETSTIQLPNQKTQSLAQTSKSLFTTSKGEPGFVFTFGYIQAISLTAAFTLGVLGNSMAIPALGIAGLLDFVRVFDITTAGPKFAHEVNTTYKFIFSGWPTAITVNSLRLDAFLIKYMGIIELFNVIAGAALLVFIFFYASYLIKPDSEFGFGDQFNKPKAPKPKPNDGSQLAIRPEKAPNSEKEKLKHVSDPTRTNKIPFLRPIAALGKAAAINTRTFIF